MLCLKNIRPQGILPRLVSIQAKAGTWLLLWGIWEAVKGWGEIAQKHRLHTLLTNTKVPLSFPGCETTISGKNRIHIQGRWTRMYSDGQWVGRGVHERDKIGMTQRDLPHLGGPTRREGKKRVSDISLVWLSSKATTYNQMIWSEQTRSSMLHWDYSSNSRNKLCIKFKQQLWEISSTKTPMQFFWFIFWALFDRQGGHWAMSLVRCIICSSFASEDCFSVKI